MRSLVHLSSILFLALGTINIFSQIREPWNTPDKEHRESIV